jgi:hypothetical protein
VNEQEAPATPASPATPGEHRDHGAAGGHSWDQRALLDVWPYHRAPTGPRPRTGPPTPTMPKAARGTHDQPWGICLSGGGVRAAAVALGALQAMQRRCMLIGSEQDRATYLSAVSGGSYMAGAYALLARQLQPAPGDTARHGVPPPPPLADVPPFHRPFPAEPGAAGAPGCPPAAGPPITPEEHYLADHTLYLTHGPGGVPGALWHLVMGILINLAILGLAVNTVARVVGWIAGGIYPQLAYNSGIHAVQTQSFEWVVLAVHGGVALASGLFSVLRPSGTDTTGATWVSLAFLAATGVWLAIIGLPYAIEALRWLLSPAVATTTVAQTSARLKVAAGTGGGLSLAVGLAQVRRLWARWRRSPAPSSSWGRSSCAPPRPPAPTPRGRRRGTPTSSAGRSALRSSSCCGSSGT